MNDADYNDIAEWLMEIESTASPSGFHGQLTGLWCRLAELPEDMALDEVDRQACAWESLQAYSLTVKEALEDADCSFEPLLPPDSAALSLRVDALADWAEGVLFGLGAAGALSRDSLSEEVQELMKDLAEICKITVDEDDDGGEDAYAEIVEYLRIAAQTLYVELHPQTA